MFSKTHGFACFLCAIAFGVWTFPALGQEQVYEHGKIIQIGERGESLDFLDEEVETVDDSLTWWPVLSPAMIMLDCWIGKTLKIHDHYSQQAAERYFAYAETCTDIPLGLDSGRGTNLKYTLLAPLYAGCPALLQNSGGWGFGGASGGYGVGSHYGVQEPIPSPVMTGPEGTTLMSPSPSAPTGGMELMPPSAPTTGSVQASPTTQVASSSKWSRMSDAEILNYFGLDSAAQEARSAELVGSLDQPVVPASTWEFADQSPSMPASRLMAQSSPPVSESLNPSLQPQAVMERTVSPDREPTVEDLKEVLRSENEKKEFSVTDKEYEKMLEIEGDLLGGF